MVITQVGRGSSEVGGVRLLRCALCYDPAVTHKKRVRVHGPPPRPPHLAQPKPPQTPWNTTQAYLLELPHLLSARLPNLAALEVVLGCTDFPREEMRLTRTQERTLTNALRKRSQAAASPLARSQGWRLEAEVGGGRPPVHVHVGSVNELPAVWQQAVGEGGSLAGCPLVSLTCGDVHGEVLPCGRRRWGQGGNG